jgi:hypothetical protein
MHFQMKLLRVTLMVITMAANKMEAQQTTAAGKDVSNEELKRANDPMANVKAFNIQDYVVTKLYGLPDQEINQLLFRYSQPIGRVLLRATMPFITTSSEGDGPTSGLGDLNLFAIYTLPTSDNNKFGIGPNLTIPTGTRDLGTGKWQAGLSVLAFFANSHIVQTGTLLQWSGSFAGDDDREDVSILTPQVFFIWQIGAGFCIRSTGILSFNFENGDYYVPVGLGVGKVLKAGKVVFNIFAEPQFTVLAGGIGQPRYQTFIGFNTQF